MLFVGNDIVDLRRQGVSAKWQDARFLNRVFTQKEREAILSARMPSRTFWCLWAAKETAYKVVSSANGPPVFAHRKFVTKPHLNWLGDLNDAGKAQVVTSYAGTDLLVEIDASADFVHAHSCFSPNTFPTGQLYRDVRKISDNDRAQWQADDACEGAFSPAERASIKHAESALVRIFCKAHIAAVLGVGPERLQITRASVANKPQPPALLIDEQPADIGLSLSHHGDWIAWAFAISTLPRPTS